MSNNLSYNFNSFVTSASTEIRVPNDDTDTSKHVGVLKYIYIQGTHKRMVRFQKLTRNLFLTLHGHNVHCQQRQLSKFLMRYGQFRKDTPWDGESFINRAARNSRCTVITDLDTSKRSTQKAFSCRDAILETGPSTPQ